MQLPKRSLFLHHPSADSVEVVNGNVLIHTNNSTALITNPDSVQYCEKECARPCVPKIVTVTFSDTTFGNCNDACGPQIGLTFEKWRNADFDNADYLRMNNKHSIELQFEGAVTGADLAQAFFNEIESAYNDQNTHDFWLSSFSVNGADLVLTFACDHDIDVYNLNDKSNATITVTQAFQEPLYTLMSMNRQFPHMINDVPGEGLDHSWFSKCESVCIITIDGCVGACDNSTFIYSENLVPGGTTGFKYGFSLFVNSAAPGYSAFIGALSAAISSCSTLDTTIGSNVPFVSDEVSGGTVALDFNGTGITFPNNFQVSNGNGSFYVPGATDLTNLAASLTALYPSGTFAAAGTVLTVSGDFATTGSGVVSIFQVQ